MRMIFLFSMLFLAASAIGQNSDAIIGEFWTQGNKARMEIYKKGNEYVGKVLWRDDEVNADGSPLLDKYNPDHSKRANRVKGMDVVFDLKLDDGKWKGRIYNPDNGKEYEVYFSLIGNGNQLKMKVWIGFLSANRIWNRIP